MPGDFFLPLLYSEYCGFIRNGSNTDVVRVSGIKKFEKNL